MNKTAWLVGILAFVILEVLAMDFSYNKGKDYQKNEDLSQPVVRDTLTTQVFVHDSITVTRVVKNTEVVRETVRTEGVPQIQEYTETQVTIGTRELGATFRLRDYGTRYEFFDQTFSYPSRTITESKFLPEPETVYRGCKFAMDLSSEFRHFNLRLAPKVGLEFVVEGTRLYPYLGAEFSRIEPKYLYGLSLTW